MKIKITTTEEREIDVTFPMYVKYNGLCKIINETDCIQVEAYETGDTMSNNVIQVKKGYIGLVALLVQDGKAISDQEFNEAFETALREINSMHYQLVKEHYNA